VSLHSASVDRRSAARTRAPQEHGIKKARVRAGRDATVLDVSTGGLFIETLHRLLPGTTIELQLLLTDRCMSIRGRVLRSTVACLRSGRVLYRGAIAFDRPLAPFPHIDGYAVPPPKATENRHAREDATPPTL